MRNFIGGWSATYDSCIAQRAIVGYAVLRGFEITTYNIRINLSAPNSIDHRQEPIFINDENLIEAQVRDVADVWGVLFVDGFGNGYALVQVCLLNFFFSEELSRFFLDMFRCMLVLMSNLINTFVVQLMYHFPSIFNRC